MARRGENVYKRKDGRWEGRTLKLDGKYRYFYAKTYREVKEKMKGFQINEEPRTKKPPIPAPNAAGLFELWLGGELSSHVKSSTYESYYRTMQTYVIPFFQKPGNERITEESVARFVKAVRDKTSISESYKKKILSIFKTALREILKGSPERLAIAEAVRLPKTETREVQVFSMKEQRLIECAALHSEDRCAFGVILCFYTGIRLGELCALKWSDIDMEAGTMSIARTVSRTKNFQHSESKTVLLVGTPKSRNSARKIPLPAFLLKLAGEYRLDSENDNGYTLSGGYAPMDPSRCQKMFKKLLKKAGVKDRKFHAIRHTFATRALELGVDIKTLSELLGHSSVSITLNVYAHSLMEQKKIAIDKFNTMHAVSMELASSAVASAVITDPNERPVRALQTV